jgi:phenylalanyl-tRNA synthetase alpha chain
MAEEAPDAETSAFEPLTLSESERAVLRALRAAGELAVEEESLVTALGLPSETVRGSLQRLRAKGLALVDEEHRKIRRLTPRGEDARARGLPERRLLARLGESSAVAPESLAAEGWGAEERSAAIGILRRRGYLESGVPLRLRESHPPLADPLPEEAVLAATAAGGPGDEKVFDQLQRRGLVAIDHRSTKRWSVSEEGARLPLAAEGRPQLGALTRELLASGAWREAEFRPYDVRSAVPFLEGARPHPYLAWLREFEEILIGLGFEEAEGPLLETEFWNSDALFMPQEHPARSIHDVLTVGGIQGHPPRAELLDRVAAAHEGRPMPGEGAPIGPGWQAPYRREIASRPILRSQTTAVSARVLAARPTPPFRTYSLDRNFRRDAVDATHHIEFRQCEGILGGEGTNLRHLVGVFRALAEAIGLKELRIRPTYFPFTEPSIEGYVRHPRLGWIEVFPGGLMRPEVLRPLGVAVPVAAWGIGVTRLAMVALKVNDIRELFQDDLARLSGASP